MVVSIPLKCTVKKKKKNGVHLLVSFLLFGLRPRQRHPRLPNAAAGAGSRVSAAFPRGGDDEAAVPGEALLRICQSRDFETYTSRLNAILCQTCDIYSLAFQTYS